MDGTYGSPNGTEWTGLMGMVARKEVDFIINGLAFVYDRAMVRSSKELGFFNPTLRQSSTNVTSRPMQLKNSEDR